MIEAVSAATTNSLSQYSAAGGVATEVLDAIRTITSLNLQPYALYTYRSRLLLAMKVGIRKGFNIGLGTGLLWAMCFFSNGLGFWYGAVLVADAVRDDCFESHCVSGGDVMAVFFSVLMGSMALGQVVLSSVNVFIVFFTHYVILSYEIFYRSRGRSRHLLQL